MEGVRMSTEESTVGARVRELRTKYGWSLRVLAERSGVSHFSIHAIERGDTTSPGLDILLKLASALRVPVGVLIGQAEPEEGAQGDERRLLEALGRLEVGDPAALIDQLAMLPRDTQSSVATIIRELAAGYSAREHAEAQREPSNGTPRGGGASHEVV